MIGCLIGVVKGRRNKSPETSDQETENYDTNDHEPTEAIVTIEDELDADLYPDPGENDQGWDFVSFLFSLNLRSFFLPREMAISIFPAHQLFNFL